MSAAEEIAAVLEGRKRWCVIHGDNAEILPLLPDKSVAHVITDPPYEAEAHTGARRSTNKAHEIIALEIDFHPITEATRSLIANEAKRVTAGWALAFCQVEAVAKWRDALVAAGGKWKRAAAWVKPDCSPQFTGDGWAQGFECIAASWMGGGRSQWNGGGRRGVFEHGVNNFGRLTNGREHPTMKPEALMLELVELFTDADEVILDPFCGSGTTGVAALRLGRRAILIEKDEKYAAIARDRMTAESRGQNLREFRAGQASLFGEAK